MVRARRTSGSCLKNWEDLSQSTRDEIEQFLQQPLRGDTYLRSLPPPPGAQAPQPPSTNAADPLPAWITDPCTEEHSFGLPVLGVNGYRCVHQTDTKFSITYHVNGIEEWADETVALDRQPGDEWPAWIDALSKGLEDAWAIYTDPDGLAYPDSFPTIASRYWSTRREAVRFCQTA